MKFGASLKGAKVAEWASQYIDYETLKAHLKLMAQTRDEGMPLVAPEALFIELMERELEKVNGFQTATANELIARVKRCTQRQTSQHQRLRPRKAIEAQIEEIEEANDDSKFHEAQKKTTSNYEDGSVTEDCNGSGSHDGKVKGIKIIDPVDCATNGDGEDKGSADESKGAEVKDGGGNTDEYEDDEDEDESDIDDAISRILISLDETIVQISAEATKLSRFAIINATGFKKILKKHDKMFPNFSVAGRFARRLHSSRPFTTLLQPLILGLSQLCEDIRKKHAMQLSSASASVSLSSPSGSPTATPQSPPAEERIGGEQVDSQRLPTPALPDVARPDAVPALEPPRTPTAVASAAAAAAAPLAPAASQSFVRQTTKYWVHPDNVTEVQLRILRHLPVLVFGRSEDYDPEISSVYLDNLDDMRLYHGRLEKRDGAQAIRVRWYGRTGRQSTFIERKTHREDWTGERSVKERFALKEKHVGAYLSNTLDFERRVLDKLASSSSSALSPDSSGGGVPADQIERTRTLAREISNSIRDDKLQPILRTFYNRTAFQLPGDSRVRISLDTELCMIREADRTQLPTRWRRSDVETAPQNEWPFAHLREGDEVCRFPYAVLEVKLQTQCGAQPPHWITSLVASPLVVAVPKFSKFVHGCASVFGSRVPSLPYWFPQMEVDIRGASATQARPVETVIDMSRDRRGNRVENNQSVDSNYHNGVDDDDEDGDMNSDNDDGEDEDEDDESRRPLLGGARRNPTVAGKFRGILASVRDLARRARLKSRARRGSAEAPAPTPALAPATPSISVPVRVEPKVFFANERTFLSWVHFATLVGGVALSLVEFGGSAGRVSGVVFGLAAVGIMGYALYMYQWRARRIEMRAAGPYDDRIGPMAIVLILTAAYSLHMALKYSAGAVAAPP